jgi:hypothetical protein
MASLKKHLSGTKRTDNQTACSRGAGLYFPICGKTSTAIEYDTFDLNDFANIPFKQRCKCCNDIFERISN